MLESPIRILIADDDDLCREILRDAIQGEDVFIKIAADGVDALEMLESSPFDILITDLNMPRMDGLTLLGHARELHPHILSIIITGFGSLESAIEAIRRGAYDYVQKPFKLEEISVAIRNAKEKITILREKTQLLKELEEAHRKLQYYTSSPCAESDSPNDTVEPEEGKGTFYLFPRHILPLSFLQIPQTDSSRILTELERLKKLKQDRIINENEFERLKKRIMDRTGPGAS